MFIRGWFLKGLCLSPGSVPRSHQVHWVDFDVNRPRVVACGSRAVHSDVQGLASAGAVLSFDQNLKPILASYPRDRRGRGTERPNALTLSRSAQLASEIRSSAAGPIKILVVDQHVDQCRERRVVHRPPKDDLAPVELFVILIPRAYD